MTDPKGQKTSFEYDTEGRVTKETRPMGQTISYSYDDAGRLASRTDAKGGKTVYVHDADDHLKETKYFENDSSQTPLKIVTFNYNESGRLESFNDGTVSASYEYDPAGRKKKEVMNFGAFSREFGYEYYKNGRKKAFMDSEGRRYEYVYDRAGRLEAVKLPTGAAISYTDYRWNAARKINLPGGVRKAFEYDGLMRPKSIKGLDPSENVLLDMGYTRNEAGNITRIEAAEGAYDFGYDDLYRLISSDAPGTSKDESFGYDPAGNRTSAWNAAGAIDHNANNQTLTYGPDSFEYDANGNTIKMKLPAGAGQAEGKTANLTWDGENRLVKVEEEGGSVIATYGYDPFGRRLWKDAKGVKTFFLYSDEGLIGEFDSSGNEIKSYGWKPGSTWGTDPVFMQKSGQYYFYHNDHLGTPRMMTSVNGGIVWKAEYEAFGKADVTVGVVENELRFPGQYFDAETGLHYNWHRFYEPGTGRYISEDPIGMRGGKNYYTYVKNKPILKFDPQGLACGSPSWSPIPNDWIIPDAPFGYDFENACDWHDRCYEGKCGCEKDGVKRSNCDKGFYNRMKLKCSTYSSVPERRIREIPRSEQDPRGEEVYYVVPEEECLYWAEKYYNVVVAKGEDPYRKAREGKPCCGK